MRILIYIEKFECTYLGNVVDINFNVILNSKMNDIKNVLYYYEKYSTKIDIQYFYDFIWFKLHKF